VARGDVSEVTGLAGRRALVTGANSGLGMETAVGLARAGATVYLGCRNPERAGEARRRCLERAPAASVKVLTLDLADLASVREAANRLMDCEPALDVLVNNAGVMAVPQGRTVDGFETHLGVNHLGHFALTGLLLPALVGGSRVVTVTSLLARVGRSRALDFGGDRPYHPWLYYGASKLDNLRFATELDRRARAAGAPLVSVAAHPGDSSTNLLANGPLAGRPRWLRNLVEGTHQLYAQPADMGAAPFLLAAGGAGVQGGECYGPDGLGQLRGEPRRVSTPRAGRGPDAGARLWAASVEATGVDYSGLAAGG
jgi:NAD(P)-dependent dehydrogenase (short-subunit alcohol dehydrogenase family)